MILTELFSDFAEFSTFAGGVDTGVNFDQLNSSARSAKKQIINIITQAVYDSIKAKTTASDESKQHLCGAMANLTMSKDSAFDIIRKKKQKIDIFKSEQEQMRRAYVESYYNAMDSLIAVLTTAADANWVLTPYYSLLSNLQIKQTTEFDMLYPIDSSFLFFFRCIPIQNEILKLNLNTYFSKENLTAPIIEQLKSALALLTVSMALRRFDPMELPASIRNLLEQSTSSRQTVNEQLRLLELSHELDQSARDIIATVDNLISSSTAIDITTQTSFTNPEDKIFLMP